MARAEFEEREYETAANAELGTGGFVMSPGQVLEELVGYDAIAAPVANHVIWQLLHVPRPTGVRLIPRLWHAGSRPPKARLPAHPVSLVLQYKRPEYLRGARASQWHFWKEPYYRFQRTERQHAVLRRLDRLLEGDAAVRYAAPAFWRFAELEAAVVTRRVLGLTGFVRPTELRSHKVWTYAEPGGVGWANPSGRRVPFESVEEFIRLLVSRDGGVLPERVDEPIERLSEHLQLVANAARAREPKLRRNVDAWVALIRQRDLILSRAGLRRIADLATITSLTAEVGASWSVTDRMDPPLPLGLKTNRR